MAESVISEHSLEYIDDIVMFSNYNITSAVNKYSALIIDGWCNAKAGVASITIPTRLLKDMVNNGSQRFDMGAYASATAFMSVSIIVAKSNNIYTINPNWAVTETGQGDVYLQLYGLK